MSTPIALMNAFKFPGTGTFRAEEISEKEARHLVIAHGFRSFVRHRGAAELYGDLFGRRIPLCRERYRAEVGGVAIALELTIPRGQAGQLPRELSLEEMRQVGFVLYRVERLSE